MEFVTQSLVLVFVVSTMFGASLPIVVSLSLLYARQGQASAT